MHEPARPEHALRRVFPEEVGEKGIGIVVDTWPQELCACFEVENYTPEILRRFSPSGILAMQPVMIPGRCEDTPFSTRKRPRTTFPSKV